MVIEFWLVISRCVWYEVDGKTDDEIAFFYHFTINTFLLCLISHLVNPLPQFFNRQARNPRFSFLSIPPSTQFSFYFRIEYIILFLGHGMFFFPRVTKYCIPPDPYPAVQPFPCSISKSPRPLFVLVHIPLLTQYCRRGSRVGVGPPLEFSKYASLEITLLDIRHYQRGGVFVYVYFKTFLARLARQSLYHSNRKIYRHCTNT